jgi:uridine kinase
VEPIIAEGIAMTEIPAAVDQILDRRREVAPHRSLLVGVTGIDASGKGYVTARLAASLRDRGATVAAIGVDGWLNLPHERFNPANPAEHFYLHAIRFDDMFERLVLPLKHRRAHHLTMDYTEETATQYRRHTFSFHDIDIILLEGIFLLKRAYRRHFDLSFWIDCTFETALQRAIHRSQEGLDAQAAIRAYETIYFPAQRIHFDRDRPREAVTAVVPNDLRIPAPTL